jgi:hypothetical protein
MRWWPESGCHQTYDLRSQRWGSGCFRPEFSDSRACARDLESISKAPRLPVLPLRAIWFRVHRHRQHAMPVLSLRLAFADASVPNQAGVGRVTSG